MMNSIINTVVALRENRKNDSDRNEDERSEDVYKRQFIDYAMKNNNDLLTFKRPEANKTVIKEMLQGGFDIPHAELVERNNVSIK